MGERTLRSLDSDLRGCRVELSGAKCLRPAKGGEVERGGVDDEGALSSSHSGGLPVEGKATFPDDGPIHAWLGAGGKPSTGSSSGIGVGIGLPFDDGALLAVIIESGARMLNI